MVAGMAGCNQDDDSICFVLSLDANCASGVASGTISHVSSGYQTGTISLSPGQHQTIKLPEAGLYRLSFKSSTGQWDSTETITSGYSLGLICD
jgi:hypothetical protein